MMFIRDGQGDWHNPTLFAADRTERHLLMRLAADFVERKGCDALIEVGGATRLAPSPRPGTRNGTPLIVTHCLLRLANSIRVRQQGKALIDMCPVYCRAPA